MERLSSESDLERNNSTSEVDSLLNVSESSWRFSLKLVNIVGTILNFPMLFHDGFLWNKILVMIHYVLVACPFYFMVSDM
jgi:hypothetical protein